MTTCYLHGKSHAKMFETSLAKIKERNPHILDKRERRHRAEAYPKMFDPNPTMDRLKASTMIASAVIKLTTSTMSVSYLVRLMIKRIGNRPSGETTKKWERS